MLRPDSVSDSPAAAAARPDDASLAAAEAIDQAARGPIPESVAANAAPVPRTKVSRADTPAEAQGRRTLSTAFVRVGPDGRLTVERHDGRVLVLRDVVMRPKDYCGVPVTAEAPGTRYCGGYAEVAAARPGG